MKLDSKTYKMNKTKNFIKNNSLFFIYNGSNKKATDWTQTEQKLINVPCEYYKIFNKIASNIFDNSTFKNFKSTINGITFFIKPALNNEIIKKRVFLTDLKFLLFKLLAVKLNNRIYSIKQLNKTYSMSYRHNKILLYQFGIVNLKAHLQKNLNKN